MLTPERVQEIRDGWLKNGPNEIKGPHPVTELFLHIDTLTAQLAAREELRYAQSRYALKQEAEIEELEKKLATLEAALRMTPEPFLVDNEWEMEYVDDYHARQLHAAGLDAEGKP